MASRTKNTRNPRNADSGLFQQLTKLLSGPITNRRAQFYRAEKRKNLDKYGSKFISASGKQFKKASYNPFEYLQSTRLANFNRSERYVEFEQMEFSLHPDTKIAIPGGYITIKELADKCKEDPNYTFIVYSYDHNKEQIVPAFGKQARQTCFEEGYKITFDNGTHIIGSFNHRLLKRDGTYSLIKDLKPGDAMMPFYRKDLIKTKKDVGDGYRWIYTMHKDAKRRRGWLAEHTLIAEWIAEREILDTEIVRHINFKKSDNRPENLLIMDKKAHSTYHANHLAEQRKNSEWMKNFSEKHSAFMKTNNPAERKEINFWSILDVCNTQGFNLNTLCCAFDTDPGTIKRKLKVHGFNNFITFAKAYNENYNNIKYRKTPEFLSIQEIYSKYETKDSLQSLAHKLNKSASTLSRSLKRKGYNTFEEFKKNYNNLKVISIEKMDKMELYDLTVDGYKNFATDTVISHNTPEINSTLDIYRR